MRSPNLDRIVIIPLKYPKRHLGPDSYLVKKLQQSGVSLVNAGNNVISSLGGLRQRDKSPTLNLRRRLRENPVSMRTVAIVAEFFNQLSLKRGRNRMFQPLGLGVDLVPLHPEHL